MKHLSRITVTGALLFTLASTANAQSGMNGTQDPTANQPGATGTTDTSTLQGGSMAPQGTQSSQQMDKAQQTMQGAQSKNMPITITPDSIQWKDAPNMLPTGAQYAVLEGGQKGKNGGSTVRIKLPANYQLPPVYSQNVERLTVLSGTVNFGVGDKLDTNAGTALPAGSFVLMPAKKHHYIWTTEDSVIQISTTGPWAVKYVNSKDDPRLNKATSPSHDQTQTNQTGTSTSPSTNGTTSTPSTSKPSTGY